MSRFFLTVLVLPLFLLQLSSSAQELTKVSATKVWDQAAHCAFTDLIDWNGTLYLTFRESDKHVRGEDGKIRLLSSSDGSTWTSVALLEESGVDLRDPKLSVTPDGRLMILVGGSIYEDDALAKRKPMVAFASSASVVGPLEEIEIDERVSNPNNWLWRVTWNEGVGYGILYQNNTKPWGLHLMKTTDGKKFDHVTRLTHGEKANESTACFAADGTMYIVTRHESGDKSGSLLRNVPYGNWIIKPINTRLGGPDLCRIGDEFFLGSRQYGDENKTVVGSLNVKTAGFTPKVELPSGGDTSYPGLLPRGNELWVSYYSSHEDDTASIYLAKIPLSDLQ